MGPPLQTLMTSRELSSGFNFWLCHHLRVAVVHLLTKFDAYIFIRCEDISILRNSRWLPSAILDFLGRYAPNDEVAFMMRTPVKFCIDRLNSFQVIRA